MRAVKDRVIVRAEALAEKTESGLYLPGNREERDRIGEIVAAGVDVKQAKPGDRVIYNVYSEMVELNGISYRVLKEENILMIIEKKDKVRMPKKDSQGKTTKEWVDLD